MGVKPTSQAAEYFANNNPNSVSLSWAETTEAKLKGKLLGCNATKWTEETRTVMGKKEKVCVSSFNVPQADLPAKYNGDLKNWEYGPTTDPLNLDFSNGINGEVGMITVGNNKGGGIPDIDRSNWNDNVQVVWDKELGKYVCQLDTYMIYNNLAGVGEAWTIKNTGGLITTRMYASGSYEVRAKVPKAPGLVWAVWTFWGKAIDDEGKGRIVHHHLTLFLTLTLQCGWTRAQSLGSFSPSLENNSPITRLILRSHQTHLRLCHIRFGGKMTNTTQ